MLRVLLTALLRVFIGAVLFASAIGRMLDVPGFIDILERYQILSVHALSILAVVVILAGLKIGELVLRPGTMRAGALLATLYHLIVTFWTASSYLRGLGIANRGYFGVYWGRPLTVQSIIEDIVMLLLSASLYRLSER